MLSQSDETIAAWKATERTLAVIVDVNDTKYTATDINSLKYDAGAYTGETFAIGSTYSNNIQIEFSHLVEDLSLGDLVQVSIGIKVSEKYVYEPLGIFVISGDIKMDRNNNLTTITASDLFCMLEGTYKSQLTYPAKVLDVILEICAVNHFNPSEELARLPELPDLPAPIEGQSYRKALGWIAQLYAGYATFDRAGKLTIRTVSEPNYELDPSQYEQGGLTKNEATYKIGGIQCQVTTKSTTRDDQQQETTVTLQVGSTSGAQIKLENNVMTQERLDYIWEQLKDINFYPFSLNWFGNPAVEAGDWLRLYDKKGNDFVVPNNGYTLEFNGGLSAVSKADQASGSSFMTSWRGSITQTIKELQHRNAPDGIVIFPTSVTEAPKNAHINDVWFKKNGNSTELWIFERQSDGTGEWQRKDIVNDAIEAEIEKQKAELEKLSKNVDDSTESFQQSLSGIYDAVENAKINTDKAVQQALDQAQKASNDLLNYASGFDSEINLLNEAKDKNKADINKLLTDVNGVKGMYADLEGNISNFNGGLNGLSAQLKDTKNQLASVKLTADGAVSNFANLQGDIASLKTRANGIEQQMLSKVGSDVFETFKSSTARELKEKLTATDLNGYVKTAELERTANGLHASVTAVEGKINNLNIGGRNYLQGTADFSWTGGIGENGALKKTIENYTDNIKMLHISSDIYSGIYTKWGQAFPNEQLQVGDDYTFSFDAKGRGTIGVVKNESEGGNPLSGTSLTNEWQRFSVSGKINALNKAFIIYFSGGYDAYIKCVKVEKGNKPTDWSPAPEDIDNEFTTVNNTLKANKVTLDVLQNGISLNAAETSKINDKISNLGVQNLVYNSEFINDGEGWSNIGNNPAGTILLANNEWDSWKGSNGLAFRNPSKQDYLVSDNKRFKVVSGQRLSASVQLHVTDMITHGQCRAGLEIKFYANERDPEIATSNQQTQFMYNIDNGQQKLLYCENVEVPSNAKYAAIRLYTFGVGNIIFNQPMLTFSSTRLPYIKDTHMIGSLQDKYAALDVKVNGINATVVNKADLSYVDQKANQLQLALTNLSVGGTNLLGGTSTEARSNDAPTSGWVEGAVYNTTQPLNERQYILSFEARGDVNGQRIGTFIWHGGLGGRNISKKSTTSLGETFNAVDGQTFVTLTDQWKRYWVLYDVDPDNTKKTAIVCRRWSDSNPSGKVYVRKVKLEVGNKATDYAPAPEDTANRLSGIDQTLTSYRTDLNVLKDGMSLRVNEIAQANAKIEELSLGGRNYLQGTADFTWPNGVGDLNSPTKVIKNYNGNIKMLHISNSGWGGFYTRWGDAFPNGQLQVGDDYTISFDAKGRGTFEVVKNESEAGNGPLSGVNLTNDWKRYSVSGKINDLNKAFVIYFKAGYDAYVKCVKIEKSNKASDWSPAPEDMLNKYASLDVKVSGINTIVATKADKSYVDQRANEINSVVANKADVSYVNQKADQWQVALQNLDSTVSGKIMATKQDLASLYESETYKGMQKIVQNSAFLQNVNGFTTQVQSMVSDELKQINLVYNSEFESGNGQEIDGWIASHPVKRGTNMYDNYYGSTSLGMWTFDNTTDQWVNAWSQMIDVNEGDHLSASVVAFYTGGIVSTPLGGCGIEIELFEREGVSRKTWAGNYEDIVNIPWGHEKTIRIDDYTIPSGITKARIGLVIKGKGNVMFAHPMLVKGKRVGIYQPSVVNKLSKLTQTLDGLKSEVHDSSINSVIGQTARMIALQISGDKNKVISQINASTEGVMIDGKHIMINGNTRIQGTLMVNDVVMKSQNNAVKFSPESLDMIGANSMLKLQSDSIQLGATSNDPRKQWGLGLSKNGLAVTVPVKKTGRATNNPEDYQREIQGYVNGGGWDYTKAEVVGSGASGIEIGLMTKQIWCDPYGGDYIAIGQYTPTNSQKTARTFTPAISYSETGAGWAPRDIHMYKPTTFHSEMHMNVPSTGYGIRTAWVSWSDWNNEKYPCFVNDTSNWGGIAFPSNGNAVMFNSAGKRFNIYETKDNKYYNGYGGN